MSSERMGKGTPPMVPSWSSLDGPSMRLTHESLAHARWATSRDSVPPTSIREHPRRARIRGIVTLACGVVMAAIALWAVVHLSGCSASAVDAQSQAVSALGIAANAAEPAWLTAYRTEGRAAADLACQVANISQPSCVASRLAAIVPVTARWSHVRDAWEVAMHAQNGYANALDACAAADAATCAPLAAASAALDDAIAGFRCAVRAIGLPQLDPLPPPAPACGLPSVSP